MKTGITRGEDALDALAKKVGAYQFSYKGGDKARRTGIMAQELEQTPLGYTVQDTPNGKMIDVAQLTGANTAMLADLARKVDDVVKFFGEAK